MKSDLVTLSAFF